MSTQEDRPTPARPSPTVLVVEDEAVARVEISRMVRGLGYQVRTARNGREALQHIEQHPGEIRLILTDVRHAPHGRRRAGRAGSRPCARYPRPSSCRICSTTPRERSCPRTRRLPFSASLSASRSCTRPSIGSSALPECRRGPSQASRHFTATASHGAEGSSHGLLEAGVHRAKDRQAAVPAGCEAGG